MMKFSTIYADPPWPYDSQRAMPVREELTHHKYGGGVSSEERYGVMGIEDLANLEIPSEKNSHLYLWTTNSFIVEAHQIAKAWGFKPKTIITWVKVKQANCLFNGVLSVSMKTGFYYRGASEHLLFAVKGSMKLTGEPHPTAVLLPREAHSVKPDYFYRMIEAQSPGPYLELFARRKRKGWSSWGNQIKSDIEIGCS